MIDSFYEIYNSPFLLANYFLFAYKNLPASKNNALLAYLVLPIVLYPPSANFLKNAKATSSLVSFRKGKERIAGLPNRISHYKEVTNQCLQYLMDNNLLCVDENMTVHINKDANLPDAKTIEELAAAKLSIIFQDIPVQTVFRLLGVKSI